MSLLFMLQRMREPDREQDGRIRQNSGVQIIPILVRKIPEHSPSHDGREDIEETSRKPQLLLPPSQPFFILFTCPAETWPGC